MGRNGCDYYLIPCFFGSGLGFFFRFVLQLVDNKRLYLDFSLNPSKIQSGQELIPSLCLFDLEIGNSEIASGMNRSLKIKHHSQCPLQFESRFPGHSPRLLSVHMLNHPSTEINPFFFSKVPTVTNSYTSSKTHSSPHPPEWRPARPAAASRSAAAGSSWSGCTCRS
jgi:hypothetical protein